MISDNEVQALKLKALILCQDYLGGCWQAVKEHDILFSRISGGLSNYLFKCTIPDYIACPPDQPRSVILRVFGQHLVERTSEILKDTTVSLLLSEWGIGPKVYAVRGSSRLEQFWEAKTLRTSDLQNPTLRGKIAKILAKFHSLNMPIMKEPRWLFDTIQNYLQKIKCLDFPEGNDKMLYDRLLARVNVDKEFHDLREILVDVSSPVLFSHNDVQPGNLLLLPSDEIKLIDYEYSGYNYRGFDLGNFFCEFMFDYQCKSYPFFRCNFDAYPSIETQKEFVETYVRCASKSLKRTSIPYDQWLAHNGFAGNGDGQFQGERPHHHRGALTRDEATRDILKREVRSLLKEASYFSLASNFMWALWSIYLSHESRIDFCYMEYGICRLFAYFYGKHQILNGTLCRSDHNFMKLPFRDLQHFIELIDNIPQRTSAV